MDIEVYSSRANMNICNTLKSKYKMEGRSSAVLNLSHFTPFIVVFQLICRLVVVFVFVFVFFVCGFIALSGPRLGPTWKMKNDGHYLVAHT